MRIKSIISSILFFTILIYSGNAFSQEDLKKEVQVVRPFEPKISDAFKINLLPVIIDTAKVDPIFEYKMKSIPLVVEYEITPIKAAKLIGEPLKKLYSSYVKLGFGNYLTPLIDFRYQSKYSKKYSYSAHLMHLSSSGKVRNNDSRKIFSGFSENNLELSGKKFLKDKTISSFLDFDNNTYYYYGYNTDLNYNPIPPRFKKDIDKQRINAFNGKVNLKSDYMDSSQVNYDLNFSYGYMQEINKINEQSFDLNIDLNYFFENEFTGINTRILSYNRSLSNSVINTDSRISNLVSNVNTLVVFNPWIGAFGPKWQIVAGVNTFYELENTKYHFYPRVSLHYNVVDYFLIPYFEYGGLVEINSFRKMLYENPYFLFPVNVKSTEYNQIITGGIRGNFSSNISYNFNLKYNKIDNMYFYVNDSAETYENTFSVVYDDLNLVNFKGEIAYQQTERLSFILKAKYDYYKLDSLEKPWHKPDYTIALKSKYNIANKIIFDVDIYGIGKRYVKLYNPVDGIGELSPIIDVNAGVEYHYTRILTAFLRFNNIGAAKYYKWNYYPSHRFNFMLGVTYSF